MLATCLSVLFFLPGTGESLQEVGGVKTNPHIVFVTGDCEYRSEESMPMLAKILEKHHGMNTTVLYALGEDGTLDPMRKDHIPGLEVLEKADLMVLFLRFRALPEKQLNAIRAFADSGKPMVGFRTSTHAFLYQDGPFQNMNHEWSREVFGQKWITHHGHFGDGHELLTRVERVPARESTRS